VFVDVNADPDPHSGNQTNADPDQYPSQTLKSQKVEFLHEKYKNIPVKKHTDESTNAFLKSGSGIRIPDLQHCLYAIKLNMICSSGKA